MIFVDSSFWIAQMVARDGRRDEALALQGVYDMGRLVTSSAVIAETWTFLRRRSGHRDAMVWLDRVLDASSLRRERVDEQLEADAWAWLRIHDERPYSFVDATSFALMRRKRITDALAFDGDFAAAGFNELRA
ncbi:MAG: PIN domain-containing protein [Thermoleophilia bacterium]